MDQLWKVRATCKQLMQCVFSLTFVLSSAVRITWPHLLADVISSLQRRQCGDLERLTGTKADKKICGFPRGSLRYCDQKGQGLQTMPMRSMILALELPFVF